MAGQAAGSASGPNTPSMAVPANKLNYGVTPGGAVNMGSKDINGHNVELMYDPATGTAWTGSGSNVQYLDASTYGLKNNQQIQQAQQQNSQNKALYDQQAAAANAAAASANTPIGNYSVNGAQQSIYTDPASGSYYYKGAGGNRYALTSDQTKQAGLSSIAGYGPNGQVYYSAAPNDGKTTEQRSLEEIGKTSPNTVASIGNLSNYYQQQAHNLQNPAYAQQQGAQYLAQADKADPASAATRNALSASYNAMSQNPGQISGGVQQDISQAARAAQTARGNAMGTAQAAQESLQSGVYGQQLQQQNLQNSQQWLGSGLTKTGQGQQLYNFNQGANQSMANNTASYLQSGNTPVNYANQHLNGLTGSQQSF
jgi:hypothetical protein